jgi:GNAT superfamily N-acetyltransferase
MNVRLILPSDEAAYRSIIERTSDDDRYDRFFHLVDALDPVGIHRFVERRPDMVGTIAFENGVALGAAHAALANDRSAELAVIVARDGRRRGVGRELVATLMGELEDRGYMRFVARSLHGNQGFARLARSVRLEAKQVEGSTVLWSRDVAPPALLRSYS